MKTQLLIFYLISFLCGQILSQSNDYQWMINTGLGKHGVTGLVNNFSVTNTIGEDFTLRNVKSPNMSITEARNDIFIIYSNGTHFNSRNTTQTDPFYIGMSGSTRNDHSFNSFCSCKTFTTQNIVIST